MAKEKRLTIRLSEEEENVVRERAAKFQLPVSKYIRGKIITDDVVMRDPETVELLKRIHTELRKINVLTVAFTQDEISQVKETLSHVYTLLGKIESKLLPKAGKSNGYNKIVKNKGKQVFY